jgi:hypothetical protein
LLFDFDRDQNISGLTIGYLQSVAEPHFVTIAVYALLDKQYGGKVGDLRSYTMTLQEERDRAKEVADYVTLDVECGGVAAAIRKFLL